MRHYAKLTFVDARFEMIMILTIYLNQFRIYLTVNLGIDLHFLDIQITFKNGI